jgi:TetR/AcrR family transcriptional regulator, lmrAB and yxaGH operons repressor
MAHRVISDDAFLEIALDLFRMYGFEGVSLKMLSDETGLEKASLYYRYPAGKDQIVTTVAESVAAWFESNIFELLDGTGTPRARISLVAKRLEEFYSSDSKASILDVLSIQSGPEELRIVLRKMTQAWIDAFTKIATENGLDGVDARSRAEEALIRIEGSLIFARTVGSGAAFAHTLKLLPDLLSPAAQ